MRSCAANSQTFGSSFKNEPKSACWLLHGVRKIDLDCAGSTRKRKTQSDQLTQDIRKRTERLNSRLTRKVEIVMTRLPITSFLLALSLLIAGAPRVAIAQTNTFPATGNVGIGTTSPQYLTHIVGNSNAELFRVGDATYGQFGVGSYSPNSGGINFFRNGQAVMSITAENGVNIGPNLTGILSPLYGLAVQGSVGIGTSSPGANLEVQKSQHYFTTVLVNNPDTTTSDYATQAQVELQVAGHLIGGIKTTARNLTGLSTSSLYLTTEGPYPVAIGTNASAGPSLAVGATAGGVSIGNSYVGTDPGSGNLIVSGRVGVGITSPQHELQVAGTIGAKEVIVSSTGADYVFDNNYKLATLSDVAAFIEANHHLPGIPSAKEVEERGMSVGDMQSKLLAKVEELTLHLIQDEKKIAELEAKVQSSGALAENQFPQ